MCIILRVGLCIILTVAQRGELCNVHLLVFVLRWLSELTETSSGGARQYSTGVYKHHHLIGIHLIFICLTTNFLYEYLYLCRMSWEDTWRNYSEFKAVIQVHSIYFGIWNDIRLEALAYSSNSTSIYLYIECAGIGLKFNKRITGGNGTKRLEQNPECCSPHVLKVWN